MLLQLASILYFLLSSLHTTFGWCILYIINIFLVFLSICFISSNLQLIIPNLYLSIGIIIIIIIIIIRRVLLNPRYPYTAGNFLTCWAAVGFSWVVFYFILHHKHNSEVLLLLALLCSAGRRRRRRRRTRIKRKSNQQQRLNCTIHEDCRLLECDAV